MPFTARILSLLGSTALALALACGGGGGSKAPATSGGGSGSGGTVTVLPPVLPGDIFWVAYQDGNGPWKVANASGGQYTFTVTDPSGRYGLAFVDVVPGPSAPSDVFASLYYFTRSEVSQLDFSSIQILSSATVSGNVTGLAPSDTGTVKVRSRTASLPAGAVGYNFTAWGGSQDVVAIRKAGGLTPDRLIVSRNLTITPGGWLPTLDFATQGYALVPQTASAMGGDAGDAITTYANWIAPKTSISLGAASGTTLAFNALPAANHLSDETHFIGAQALQSGTTKGCLAGKYTKSPIGVVNTVPAKVATPLFGTAITSPYYRPTISWAPFPGALLSWIYAQDYTNYIFWDASFSAGWLAGNTASSYTLPDFSGLAGWDNAWGLRPGSTLDWRFQNSWTSSPNAAFYLGTPGTHPEGESYWRSWMTLSLPATMQGGPALSTASREAAESIGHRLHRTQDPAAP